MLCFSRKDNLKTYISIENEPFFNRRMTETVEDSSDAISGSDDDTEDNIFAHRKFKLPTRTNPFDETDDGKGQHKSFF